MLYTHSLRPLFVASTLAVGVSTLTVLPAVAAPVIPGGSIIDSAQPPTGTTQTSASPEQKALAFAQSKLGAPYAWGATGPESFDCSGLMQWAYKQAGVDIPRTSEAQQEAGTPVVLDALQPGDLVFFYGGSHVGIYAGNGKVVHAPEVGDYVKTTSIEAMAATEARHY